MRLFLLSLAFVFCTAGTPMPPAPSALEQRIADLEALRRADLITYQRQRAADLQRIRDLEHAQGDNLKRIYSLELATYIGCTYAGGQP